MENQIITDIDKKNDEPIYKSIRKLSDDTYVIDFDGINFQVTPDYPPAGLYGETYTYEKLTEYAEEHPEEVTEYVEPEPPAPDEEALKRARIAELEAEAQGLLPYILAGIDADIYQQKLTDVMLEIEELKGNI